MVRLSTYSTLIAIVALLACAQAQSETAAVTAPEESQQKAAPDSSPMLPVESALTAVMPSGKPEEGSSSPSASPAVEVTAAMQTTAAKESPAVENVMVTTTATGANHEAVQVTAVPVSAEQPKPASGNEVSTTKAHTRGDKAMQCGPGERLSKANKVLSCQPCLPGHFQNKHSSAWRCKNCPAGTYASSKGSTKCKKCPKGKSSKAGQRACMAGQKKSSKGSSSSKKPAH